MKGSIYTLNLNAIDIYRGDSDGLFICLQKIMDDMKTTYSKVFTITKESV